MGLEHTRELQAKVVQDEQEVVEEEVEVEEVDSSAHKDCNTQEEDKAKAVQAGIADCYLSLFGLDLYLLAFFRVNNNNSSALYKDLSVLLL